jgi:4-amino-4-deoxy-L-arabinose transferase-like glycosyltransferase
MDEANSLKVQRRKVAGKVTGASVRPASIKIDLELEPGTDLEVQLVARTSEGKPIASRVVKFSLPGAVSAAPADTAPSAPVVEEGIPPTTEEPVKAQSSKGIKIAAGWVTIRHWFENLGGSWKKHSTIWLLIGALLIYLVTRLIALESFPIYFFTDEAVQTILAQDFVRDNFTSYTHEFFPTYFVNGSQYNLSTSVYLQIIPLVLFGKSIFVTRATSAFITLLAAAAVGLTMWKVFKSRYSWLAILLLSITPAWFLHSRTAFETALGTTFFAVFLYCYLIYRTTDKRYLYAAVLAGALCFYSYSPSQMVMLVAALLLLISDFKYHWQNRMLVLKAFGVAILCAIPYARFMAVHGVENYRHLIILQSYWLSDKTILQKLGIFGLEYLKGLNPFYWFFPNNVDFIRHVMKGYNHLLLITLPFFLFGIFLCFRNFRKPEYRAVLIAFLAAPAGAALVELGVTRALFMVIPAVLLTALGIDVLLSWLEKHRVSHNVLAGGLFCVLSLFNFYMLHDAVVNGPIWYTDYGLGGMQYGGKELFGETREFLKENPGTYLIISPSWANGADVLARFFFNDPQPFVLGSIDGFIESKGKLTPNTTFVVTPEELDRLKATAKFTNIRILKTLPYPTGKTGFYFIKLDYVPNIDEIFAAEKASRLSFEEVNLNLPDGTPVRVRYSPLDMGPINNAFDGNENSIIRSAEANPLRIQLFFKDPRSIDKVIVRVGGTPTEVTVDVYPPGSNTPQTFRADKPESPDPRDVVVDFGRSLNASRVDIATKSVRDAEPAHVHIWEITLPQPQAK